jgi:hypothetical protein
LAVTAESRAAISETFGRPAQYKLQTISKFANSVGAPVASVAPMHRPLPGTVFPELAPVIDVDPILNSSDVEFAQYAKHRTQDPNTAPLLLLVDIPANIEIFGVPTAVRIVMLSTPDRVPVSKNT